MWLSVFMWNKGFVKVQATVYWNIGNRLQMAIIVLLQVC